MTGVNLSAGSAGVPLGFLFRFRMGGITAEL